MAFYVGQKVVRFRSLEIPSFRIANLKHPERKFTGPEMGAVVTIRYIGAGDPAALYFAEHDNSDWIAAMGVEPGFDARCYRPLVEDADKLAWARKLVEPNAKSRELVKESA